MSNQQYSNTIAIPTDTSSIYYAFSELLKKNKLEITKEDLLIIKKVFDDYDPELGLDHWKSTHNPHLRNVTKYNIEFWKNLYDLIIEKGINEINQDNINELLKQNNLNPLKKIR